MELILWRHAEAEEALEGQNDSERKLTSKGRVQAVRMAEWLLPRLPPETRMLVSPARRTRETAARLGPDGAAYLCNNGGFRWIRDPHPTDPFGAMTPLEAAGLSVDVMAMVRCSKAALPWLLQSAAAGAPGPGR